MAKICLLLIIFHCCWCDPPAMPDQMNRLRRYKADVVLNLTYYLCKDATIKLWHADRVQQRYKGSLSYELGTISAGIQDIFRRMIATYKKQSNLTNFRLKTFHNMRMEIPFSAYHEIKGDYNALCMEKNMFFDILNAYHARQAATTRRRYPNAGDRTLKRRSATVSYKDKEAILKRRLKYEKWTDDDHIDIAGLISGDVY